MVISSLLRLAWGLYCLAGLPVSQDREPPSPARMLFTVGCASGQGISSLLKLYQLTFFDYTDGFTLYAKLHWVLYPLICTVTTAAMAFRYDYFSQTFLRVNFVQDMMRSKGIADGPPTAWQITAVAWAVVTLTTAIMSCIINVYELVLIRNTFFPNKGVMLLNIVRLILIFPSFVLFFAVIFYSSLQYLIEAWILGEVHRELSSCVRSTGTETEGEKKAGPEAEAGTRIGSGATSGKGLSAEPRESGSGFGDEGGEAEDGVQPELVECGRRQVLKSEDRETGVAGYRAKDKIDLDVGVENDEGKALENSGGTGSGEEEAATKPETRIGYGKVVGVKAGAGMKPGLKAEDNIELDDILGGEGDGGVVGGVGMGPGVGGNTIVALKRCKDLLDIVSQAKRLRLESQSWQHIPLSLMIFAAVWYYPILVRMYFIPGIESFYRQIIAVYLVLGTIVKLGPIFSNQFVTYKKNALMNDISQLIMKTGDPGLRKALLKLYGSISDKYPDSPNILLDLDFSLIDALVSMSVLTVTTFV